MEHAIWDVLNGYEGRWVAVAGRGEVVAHATSLMEVMQLVASKPWRRVTFLYAAAPVSRRR